MRYNIKLKTYGDNTTHKVAITDDVKDKFSYTETTITTDRRGCITWPGFKEADKKVFILGDSWVECSFVNEGRRISDIVNIVFQKYTPDLCAYNYGMSGSTLLHLFNLFVNKILPITNACILLFPGGMSAAANYWKNTYWSKSKFGPFTDDAMVPEYVTPGDCYVETKKLLRLFYDTVNISGNKLLCGITPCNPAYEWLNNLNKELKSFYIEQNMPFIDLSVVLPDNEHLFYDITHCNEAGSLFYGTHIAFQLMQNLGAAPLSFTQAAANCSWATSTALTAKELNDFLASLDATKFVVGLFVGYGEFGQDEWLNQLATCLRKAGYTVIGIVIQEATEKCSFTNVDQFAVINPAEINELERVNVFIVSDLDAQYNYPLGSKVLACCHGLMASEYDHAQPWHVHNPRYFDAWMCSYPLTAGTRSMTHDLWDGITNRAFSKRKGKNFYIIPQGYPRLAVLSEQIAAMNLTPDSIVYAPVQMGYFSDMKGNGVKDYGTDIIKALLDNFPNYKIIFRPSPKDFDAPEIKKICANFTSEPRFVVDKRKGRIFSFSHGAVLVTDVSHIFGSFAFTTLRPAFSFRPWEKEDAEPCTIPGGWKTSTLPGLVAAIQSSLDSEENTRIRIGEEREKLFMPFDNSLTEIASWLPDLYNDKPRDSWINIERCENSSLAIQIKLISKVAGHYAPALCSYIAASIFLSCNPESPMLGAFALHMGKVHSPNQQPWSETCLYLGALLGKILPSVPWKDIDVEFAHILYKQALEQAEAEQNHDALVLIKRLSAEYDSLFPGPKQ